jgi:exodeoxyribonuclease VII small subunit
MSSRMSQVDPMSYSASMRRLKELVGKLEGAQVDVDELEAVVKEAVEIIGALRARLRTTQGSVDALLAGLSGEAVVETPTPAVASRLSKNGSRHVDLEDLDSFADS